MESATVVVMYPLADMSHVVPMVELGKLIHTHHPSLSFIILITPAATKAASASIGKYIAASAAATPFITFRHLPAVAMPPELSSHGFVDLCFEIPELYSPKVHDALVDIVSGGSVVVKGVVLGFFTTAAFQVAKELGLPTYYFFTSGASGLCPFLYLPTLRKTTPENVNDLDVYFDVPGVPPIHASDMPLALFNKHVTSAAGHMAESSGIIVNSFVGFEERAVEALRDGKCIPDRPTPPVYVIGPLIADQADPGENECLKWLDSQPSKSVVFLCFGSRGVFKREQLKEMAIGLERSGQRFLWVVRDPPPGDEDESTRSSSGEFDLEGFLGTSFDKGMVVRNWAPQAAILAHDSLGGFVSHCGWNSALEAVVAGVPMVAWPLYAEQKMNRVFLVEEIKVAVAVKMAADGFVTAEAVEEAVVELMEGEGGRTVRERTLEISERAKAAVEDGGSSRVDLSDLIKSWVTM